MRVIVASGLGNGRLGACVEALLESAPDWEPDVHVVRERGSREETWNAALDEVGRDRDVLFLGDDVQLSPGFREALARGAEHAEIVGLCTLEPGSDRIGDRGYRLARVDGRITVDALDRGRPCTEAEPFGVRACDAVCGCLFWVKASVLERVPRFQPEGVNRWGELIFALEARRHGARVAVVEHYVEHAGNGTKGHPDPALASTAWTTEREPWERLVERWVAPAWVQEERRTRLEPALQRFLEASGPLVLYGAGTVADLLLGRTSRPREVIDVCSGLPEEVGRPFHGRPIQGIASLGIDPEARILITPLGRGEKIAGEVLEPLLPAGFRGEIACVVRRAGSPGEETLGLAALA